MISRIIETWIAFSLVFLVLFIMVDDGRIKFFQNGIAISFLSLLFSLLAFVLNWIWS